MDKMLSFVVLVPIFGRILRDQGILEILSFEELFRPIWGCHEGKL